MQAQPGAHWQTSPEALRLSLTFAGFSEAFAFLTRVALLAEKHDHHPEIHNVYNRVELTLRTHDAGNVVTERDKKLAVAIDGLLSL